MALPEQPPLTAAEQNYFLELEKKFDCKVEREVDPRKPRGRDNVDSLGWYYIGLDSLDCDFVKKEDSLAVLAKNIAVELHRDILGKQFLYPYDHISVGFSCPTAKNSYYTTSYKFQLNEL